MILKGDEMRSCNTVTWIGHSHLHNSYVMSILKFK